MPRLIPLNSVRTRAEPGCSGPRRTGRSSTTPLLAYHTARATWILPVDLRAIMLPAPVRPTAVGAKLPMDL